MSLQLNKKKTHYILTICIIVVFALVASACSGTETSGSQETEAHDQKELKSSETETEPPAVNEANITFQDATNRTITLEQRPERIVVLSPEFLELLYAVGGQAVGRMEALGVSIPEEAEAVASVGTVSQISLEQVVALKPDLVIGQARFHKELVKSLESSGIDVALMSMSSYEDMKSKAEWMTKIAGTEEQLQEKLKTLDDRVNEVLQQLPGDHRTFINLNVTPGGISIQKDGTTGLEIAKMLGLSNVAETLATSPDSPTTSPYSMETLAKQNPDYIFMIIHGQKAVGDKKIKEELESNPAWASIGAVKEQRVIVVPSDLFLTNPGLHYDESLKYLAKLVYPEIFGDAE
ncbi:ABC transporter substrate-binding protein [Paenibacillus sp. MDMC362]|uniref:ABC transporter substrate-binding protein n=1 Tax=Paenibacillus sp. MDMC362 TaxID=2977365 RepID=UPI000DC380CA|nr:ABC transporter substrate-binding protein [Paenibacillus sp. MDMC362]RAR42245.1 ABC transporter substrate-binding protein [Paenibacillus sp. MDMC362]